MKKWLQSWALCLVLSGWGVNAWAGSYESFFQAITFDSEKTVRYWLDRGFDPNSPNEKLVPALIFAIQQESYRSAKVLIDDSRTQLDIENAQNETPLMWAALRNQIDIAQLLIDRGAEVNHQGWTALHYAASRNHIEMMRLLLDHSAYIDASAPNGSTPLMMAVLYGSPKAVKLLLEEGADPTLTNQNGNTALDLAVHANKEASAAYIQAFIQAWHQQEAVNEERARREAIEDNESSSSQPESNPK